MRAALVGQGISRSLTPAMHMAEGRAQDLAYVYDIIDTSLPPNKTRALSEIVKTAQTQGLAGLNITHPYKMEIMQYLDELSDNANRLGAVNTVVFSNGRRIGHNTDLSGFVTSFQQQIGDHTKDHVLLLGAGGAGTAVAFGLLECDVGELLIHDINPDQSQALVEKLHPRFPAATIRRVQSLTTAITSGLNGIVNATPMGMASHPGAALPLDMLLADIWVVDIVYFPIETKFLAHARALGCPTISGAGMAVYQAAHAFELFTGYRANPQRLTATMKRFLNTG